MDGVPDLRTPSIPFLSQLDTQLAATLVPFPIANFANGVLGYPTDKSVCHWASPNMFGHIRHSFILISLSSTLELISNVSIAIEPIKKYKVIHCYLDNDDTSKRAVDSSQDLLGDKVQNMFASHTIYKDLNNFLRYKKNP